MSNVRNSSPLLNGSNWKMKDKNLTNPEPMLILYMAFDFWQLEKVDRKLNIY